MTRTYEQPPSAARATDFDDVIKHVGQFGPWQQRIVLYMCVVILFNAGPTLASTFLGLAPKYRCRIPRCDVVNASYYAANTTLPTYALSTAEDIEALKSGKTCQYYAALPSETTCGEYVNALQTASTMSLKTRSTECTDKIFDTSVVSSSIVTDYDITCDKEFWADTVASLHKVGVLFGSFFAGYIGDTYGRMKAVMFGGLMTTICGILTIFMPSLLTYTIFLVGAGMGSLPLFIAPFLMALETTGPRYAVTMGIAAELPWSIGSMIVGFQAYMIRDWIYLALVVYIPVGVTLAAYWFVPESPRWLLAVGRTKEARRILEKAARDNGRIFPSHLMTDESGDGMSSTLTDSTDGKHVKEFDKESIKPPPSQAVGLRDLFALRVLRFRTLNLFVQWLGIAMAFYGLTHASTDLFGNKHMNFVASSFMEIIGIGACLSCIHCVGRKYLLTISQLGAGVACLVSAFLGLITNSDGSVHPAAGTVSALFAFTGKACATCGFALIFPYTSELYPTAMRGKAVGTCSMVGRVGSIASYLVNLLKFVWSPGPSVVYGLCTLLAGFLTFALPETAGLSLPESLKDATSIATRSTLITLHRFPRSFREFVTDPNFVDERRKV